MPPASPRLVPRNIRQIVAKHGQIPIAIYRSAFPTPAEGLKLIDLGLRERTRRILENAGFSERPQQLGSFSLADVLGIPGFGQESVFDLAESQHRANTPRKGPRILPRNLRTILEAHGHSLPREFLAFRLLQLGSKMRLVDLGLKTRTMNALEKAGYGPNPAALSSLTAATVLSIPRMGKSGLVHLVETLYARQSGRPAKRIPVSHEWEDRSFLRR